MIHFLPKPTLPASFDFSRDCIRRPQNCLENGRWAWHFGNSEGGIPHGERTDALIWRACSIFITRIVIKSFIIYNCLLIFISICTPSKSTSMIKNSSATSSKRRFALRRQQQGDLRVAPAPIIEDAVAPTNVSALTKPSATRDSETRSIFSLEKSTLQHPTSCQGSLIVQGSRRECEQRCVQNRSQRRKKERMGFR